MESLLTDCARAKLNLYLHVTGRRPDGFHTLDSLAIFPPIGDRLTLEPADRLTLTIDGPFAGTLAAEPDNLVLRAARAFGAAIGRTPNFAFRLTKFLPIASGIGGGSADAAAACRLLARAWSCPIPDRLAASLGADVPVCLASTPARMGGIGDILTAAPALPPFVMVLINPGVAISTPAIFKARTGAFSSPAILPTAWPDAIGMVADLAQLRNDLEPPAIALAPPIATVLATLRAHPACLLARMSGSGATCFGLFASAPAAGAFDRVGWWVEDGREAQEIGSG